MAAWPHRKKAQSGHHADAHQKQHEPQDNKTADDNKHR